MKISLYSIVIDCADNQKLSEFYHQLLGWDFVEVSEEGWKAIQSSEGLLILFQQIDGYIPPVWPQKKNKQGQMMHIDFMVDDLNNAIEKAVLLGATVCPEKYYDSSRTLLDPEGHPFCLETLPVDLD